MQLKHTLAVITLTAYAATLAGCKTGYNRIFEESEEEMENAIDCNEEMVFSNPSSKTTAVFDLVSDLSCERIEDFVLSGQSLGNGDQIVDTDNTQRNYATLIGTLAENSSRRIAVASIDYAKEANYTLTRLESANTQLKRHADNNGIISVTWSPLNPWNSSLILEPAATRNDIAELSSTEGDPTDGKEAFDEQLDIVLNALEDLADDDVPVLFAPFPEMNRSGFWYSAVDGNESDDKFENLWRYVVGKVRDKSLNNVLMVYAPRSGRAAERVSATWGYPGENEVDIVAAINYSDDLFIIDDMALQELNKPMGMTRLAPRRGDGNFDNKLYESDLSERYPHIAYWIADHNTAPTSSTSNDGLLYAIVSNQDATELLDTNAVATTRTIELQGWLETSSSSSSSASN